MGLGAGAIVGIVIASLCLFCCCYIVVKKRAKKKAAMRPKPQETFEFRPTMPAGGKNPSILSGVKVLELATVVAAPTCSYVLAELGAEVVKVETKKGDMWRKMFLEYQGPDKRDSITFDICNFGKASVCIDMKTDEGKAEFKKLLAQCDIFIVNVRNNVLKEMKLDYNSVKDEFPHVIYGHISAWGQVGPEKDLPGYDLGAYHAMTGLARTVCSQTPDASNGMFAAYPTAQGDCTTGITLAAGVMAALRARFDHGSGRYIHASLLGVGTWCMGSVYSRMDEDERKDELPTHHPTHVAYCTKDNLGVQLTGLGNEESQTRKLVQCLEMDGVNEFNLEEKLTQAIAKMNRNAIKARFDTAGVFYSIPARRDFSNLESYDKMKQDCPLLGKMLLPGTSAGLNDISVLHKFPFQLRTGFHMAARPSPALGAHTDDYLKNGFTELPTAITSKNTEPIDKDSQPFRDGGKPVSVIELSGIGASAASCGRWLSDMGAKVTVVSPPESAARGGSTDQNEEFPGQNYMKKAHPRFLNNLHYGKDFLNMNLNDPKLREEIGKAGVFITNLPRSILRKNKLDHESMLAQYPKLVYGLVTMRGLDEPEGSFHDVGPFLCESGNWSVYTMANPVPSRPPPQLGEIKAGIVLSCAVNAALFKRARTGEGNFCHTSLLRVGTFTAFQINSLQHQVPAVSKIYDATDIPSMRLAYPVPTANAYRSNDGVWFQFLGVETPRWLMPFAKAFGLKGKVIRSGIYHGVKDIALGSGTFFEKVGPLFATLNQAFIDAVESKTAAEIKKILDDNGLWYCYSRIARDLRVSDQARANKFFRMTAGGTVIKTPLEFGVMEDSDEKVQRAPLLLEDVTKIIAGGPLEAKKEK